jgi:hypothetical protein
MTLFSLPRAFAAALVSFRSHVGGWIRGDEAPRPLDASAASARPNFWILHAR